MPYTKPEERTKVNTAINTSTLKDWTAGDLTYGLTRLIYEWLKAKGINYLNCAIVLGCLLSTILEFYRRVVANYEDKKIQENGDVY